MRFELLLLLILSIFCIGCANWQLKRGIEAGRKDFYRTSLLAYRAGWVMGYFAEMEKNGKAKEIPSYR